MGVDFGWADSNQTLRSFDVSLPEAHTVAMATGRGPLSKTDLGHTFSHKVSRGLRQSSHRVSRGPKTRLKQAT